MKLYFVYIMANKRNDTPSIGITGDLAKRVFQHKHGSADSFTRKYKVYKLVYYEPCGDVYQAIIREKQPKKWNRTWKLDLIESENPSWRDLSEDFS